MNKFTTHLEAFRML